MGDNLAGIEEDVPFDWAGAERLAAELRSAASTLDAQIPDRNAYASDALVDWRGVFSEQFGTRMTTCTIDAGRLADAMELAANQVDELARLAREEQDRREAAREWKRQQDNEGILDKVGDFFGGEDEPPIPPPVQPPVYTAQPHLPPGPTTSAGTKGRIDVRGSSSIRVERSIPSSPGRNRVAPWT